MRSVCSRSSDALPVDTPRSLYWSNSPLPIFLLYSAAQPAVCHQDFHSVQCWTPRHCLSLVPGKCCVAVRWLWWGLVSFNKLYNCLGHHQPVGEEKQVCCGWWVGDALSPLPCPHNIYVISSFIFTSYLTCFLIWKQAAVKSVNSFLLTENQKISGMEKHFQTYVCLVTLPEDVCSNYDRFAWDKQSLYKSEMVAYSQNTWLLRLNIYAQYRPHFNTMLLFFLSLF